MQDRKKERKKERWYHEKREDEERVSTDSITFIATVRRPDVTRFVKYAAAPFFKNIISRNDFYGYLYPRFSLYKFVC